MKKWLKVLIIILSSILASVLIIFIISSIRNKSISKKLEDYDKEVVYPSVDFVQGWMFEGYEIEDYNKYFNELKHAGYSSIIFQYSLNNSPDKTLVYYPTSSMSNYFDNVDTSKAQILENVLDSAYTNNFDVYVGLSVSDGWWSLAAHNDKNYLNKISDVDNLIINEIHQLYSNKQAFKGWYYSEEFFSNPIGLEKKWAKLVNRLITTLDSLNDHRPLMLSSFRHTTVGLITNEYLMWRSFFKEVDFREGDIFAPQDSIGKLNMNGKISPSSYALIYDYLNNLKKAVEKEEGLKMWVNVELFQQLPDYTLLVGDFSRIKKQINLASMITDTVCSFSFSHYALECGTNDTLENRTAFYNNYLDYLQRNS